MTNLDTAVAEAAQELINKAKESKGEKIETPAEEVVEAPTEETPVEENSSEETPAEENNEEEQDLEETQLQEAKKLYKALMNPQQRVAIIAELAERSGLLKNPPENNREVKETVKSIKDIIQEALPEFPGLAEKLGGAVEKAVQAQLDELRSEQEQQMQSVHLSQLENQVNASISRLRTQTNGVSKKFEAKMAELSNKLIMGEGMTIDQYVASLYAVASAGSGSAPKTGQNTDKIRRNATNASDRIKSSTGPGSPGKFDSVPSKKMSLNDSVNWAIAEASKGRLRE